MSGSTRSFALAAMWALPIWAILLFLGTLTRQPDPQTEFAEFASYVTTQTFLWSHLIASIVGAAVGSIGAMALMLYLLDSPVSRLALIGAATMIAANTITASIFGAAAFAQPAVGRMFQAGQQNALEFYNEVYSAPLFGTAVVGLLLFIAGGVILGIVVARSGRFPRWTGWVFALATAGFVLSNFLLPLGQSIMSALLIAATVVIAWTARQASRREEPTPSVP